MSANHLALQAAGIVGTWETNVPAALSILDEGAAALLAGDVRLAGRPIPLETALSRTHPDDRGWVFERIRQARQAGGPISVEYRILTGTGDVRWILNRGCLRPNETGAMHGWGTYIDTTDSHLDPFLPADMVEPPEDDPLIVAADHYLQAHAAIISTGHPRLRQLSDLTLREIGLALAQRMSN